MVLCVLAVYSESSPLCLSQIQQDQSHLALPPQVKIYHDKHTILCLAYYSHLETTKGLSHIILQVAPSSTLISRESNHHI